MLLVLYVVLIISIALTPHIPRDDNWWENELASLLRIAERKSTWKSNVSSPPIHGWLLIVEKTPSEASLKPYNTLFP